EPVRFSVVTLAHGPPADCRPAHGGRSEEHTSELQSHLNLVCRLLLAKKFADSFQQQVRQRGVEILPRSQLDGRTTDRHGLGRHVSPVFFFSFRRLPRISTPFPPAVLFG